MGAWGTGNFDNDTALDWVYDLEDREDLSLVVDTIDAVLQEEYIDTTVAEEALVAIEVLARLKGNFGKDNAYSEDVDKWVKNHPLQVEDALLQKAKEAIDMILGDKSELKELWEEVDEYDTWSSEVLDLKDRLG
jgi:hypothetical protein